LLAALFAAAFKFGAEAAFAPPYEERPVRKIHTVEEAKALPDDARVTLRGHVVDQVRPKHYTFRDGTGSITAEIDDDEWRGLTVGPADRVEIYGEVDRDLLSTEIDVEYIRKLDVPPGGGNPDTQTPEAVI
jgi:uncharacterized protein (TIGR00156 family)